MYMYRLSLFLTFLMLLGPFASRSQPPGGNGIVKQPRILILVDGSSSMLQPWNGSKTRFEMAGKLVEKLIDSVYSVNNQVEFGLRVYGHRSPAQDKDCYDSRREVMFSKDNYTQMVLRMASLTPRGVSPIAYSIRMAAEEDMIEEDEYSYSLILITDGGESCGGDICQVTRSLLAKKIFFKPYILSLVDYSPLRQQYDCLGQYLQVTKNDEIATAVGTIVDAYRRNLVLAQSTSKPVKTSVAVPVPSVLHIPSPAITLPSRDTTPAVQAPPAPRTRERVSALPLINRLRLLPLQAGTLRAAVARRVPPMTPVQAEREPVTRDNITALRPVDRRTFLPLRFGTAQPRPRTVPRMAPVQPEAEPVAVARVEIAPLRPLRVVVASARIGNPVQRKARTLTRPVIKAEAEPVAAVPTPAAPRPTPTPARPAPRPVTTRPAPRPQANQPVEAEFTATSEPARESSIEVYFTDGKGTFYHTSPELHANDPKTGATVKKFYRTVDPAGAPDAQLLQPGTYNILVAGRSNLVAKNVELAPNEKKKVYIKVAKSTIRFRYEPNSKRPVTEFEALLSKLFQPGPAIRQRCTAELEYEAGNYRIEINTQPVTRYSLEIEFNTSYDVTIPEPGFVQFTNRNAVGRVSLFRPMNDAFVRFLGTTVNGNPDEQKIQLQPGSYEAHWVKNPNLPYASESIVRFIVRSNNVTDVELQ